jgi:hypothetical protein
MSNQRNRLQAEPDEPDYKSISSLAALEFFVVGNIVDGEGLATPSRVVCRIAGTEKFFFPFAKGMEEGMKSVAPWLQKLLDEKLGGKKEAAATPPDMDESVATGSPR